MKTSTVRLVGAELIARVGGTGVVVTSPELAADELLRNRQVRVPNGVAFAKRLRKVISERALAGAGPDGQGANWQGEPEETSR